MENKIKALFESYNLTIEENFNKALEAGILKEESMAGNAFLKPNPEAVEQWSKSALKELDGLTPDEFIKSLGFEELIEVFKTGSIISDWDLPDILLDRLKGFGERTVDLFINLSKERSTDDGQDLFCVPQMAIQTLGNWKIEKAVGPLIEIICMSEEAEDLLAEEAVNALAQIGKPAVQPLISALETSELVEDVQEYLMEALVRIGRMEKQDSIYRCLKNTFLKMDNKVVGAEYLADYNDQRAITFLRGYIEKNMQNMDKETIQYILLVIKRMGGIIDDLLPSIY
ncbi:MAG: hypothetical protein N2645_04205 [Clostridia bacterium]|nr:hypothetical protein [Clostridia bacterium]